MVYVKNARNTSSRFPEPTCKCNSWLEHWEINRYWPSAKTAGFCRCCKNSFNRNELNGAHVIKTNSLDNSYYIVPLCDSCNNYLNDKPFPVNENDLVPANYNYCINK